MKKKKLFSILFAIILICGVFGFKQFTAYLQTRPEVSIEDAQDACQQYKTNLIEYYDELNDAYKKLSPDEMADDWRSFSSTWMVGLTNSRPIELNKRLPKDINGIKENLVRTNGDLVLLWNEYDKIFNGKDMDSMKIEELKQNIQNTVKE